MGGALNTSYYGGTTMTKTATMDPALSTKTVSTSPTYTSPTLSSYSLKLYGTATDAGVELIGKTLEMRALRAEDAGEYAALHEVDPGTLSVLIGDAAASAEQFEAMAQERMAVAEADLGYSFGIWQDGQLVGMGELQAVVRGAINSASLGLTLAPEVRGTGAVYEAFTLLLEFGFDQLGLHRIECAVDPTNESVKGALKHMEIRSEGISERYMQVGDAWVDQERFAITAEEWSSRRDSLLEEYTA
jgi:ribosomal-protein-alanine N-acetyltransferase